MSSENIDRGVVIQSDAEGYIVHMLMCNPKNGWLVFLDGGIKNKNNPHMWIICCSDQPEEWICQMRLSDITVWTLGHRVKKPIKIAGLAPLIKQQCHTGDTDTRGGYVM